MPKKDIKTKFEVGDIVISKATNEKGIVVDLEKIFEEKGCLETADVVTKTLKDIASGKICAVTDFEESMIEEVPTSIIEPCQGLTDTSICDKCVVRFKCWTTRRK